MANGGQGKKNVEGPCHDELLDQRPHHGHCTCRPTRAEESTPPSTPDLQTLRPDFRRNGDQSGFDANGEKQRKVGRNAFGLLKVACESDLLRRSLGDLVAIGKPRELRDSPAQSKLRRGLPLSVFTASRSTPFRRSDLLTRYSGNGIPQSTSRARTALPCPSRVRRSNS